MERLKIYLDNCCYNRPYDDQFLVAENAANRFESKRNDIQNFIDTYTHTYVSENVDEQVNFDDR